MVPGLASDRCSVWPGIKPLIQTYGTRESTLTGRFTSTFFWLEPLSTAGIRDHHSESRSSQFTLQWDDTPQIVTIHPVPTFCSVYFLACLKLNLARIPKSERTVFFLTPSLRQINKRSPFGRYSSYGTQGFPVFIPNRARAHTHGRALLWRR